MIKVAVVGSTGKVGKEVVRLIDESSDMSAVSIVRPDSELLSGQAETKEKKIAAFGKAAFSDVDVIIDFSTPDTSLELVDLLQGISIPLVVGTTGFSERQNKILWDENKSYPILIGSNFTEGFEQFAAAGEILASSLGNAELTIGEVYHQLKKPEPSGTTQLLRLRCQPTGSQGESREIKLDIQRSGQTPGINSLRFDLRFSTVELKLTVHSRAAYAAGAIEAARWLLGKSSGIYQPSDMTL